MYKTRKYNRTNSSKWNKIIFKKFFDIKDDSYIDKNNLDLFWSCKAKCCIGFTLTHKQFLLYGQLLSKFGPKSSKKIDKPRVLTFITFETNKFIQDTK